MDKEQLLKQLFQLPREDILDIYEILNGNITKDNKLATALNCETFDIKTYLKLKNILNIDNELFNQILLELEEGRSR